MIRIMFLAALYGFAALAPALACDDTTSERLLRETKEHNNKVERHMKYMERRARDAD